MVGLQRVQIHDNQIISSFRLVILALLQIWSALVIIFTFGVFDCNYEMWWLVRCTQKDLDDNYPIKPEVKL